MNVKPVCVCDLAMLKKKTKQKKHKVCLMNFPILDKCKSIVDVLNYQKCELFIVNIP